MWQSEGFKSGNKTCSIHIITNFKNWSNYFLPLLKSEFLEPPEIFLYVRRMEVHTFLNQKTSLNQLRLKEVEVIKLAATYSPAGVQYHRRGWA